MDLIIGDDKGKESEGWENNWFRKERGIWEYEQSERNGERSKLVAILESKALKQVISTINLF